MLNFASSPFINKTTIWFHKKKPQTLDIRNKILKYHYFNDFIYYQTHQSVIFEEKLQQTVQKLMIYKMKPLKINYFILMCIFQYFVMKNWNKCGMDQQKLSPYINLKEILVTQDTNSPEQLYKIAPTNDQEPSLTH